MKKNQIIIGVIVLVILILVAAYYFRKPKNSITVKDVDWDNKTATVDLRSGDIGGDYFATITSNRNDKTTNGFVHVVKGDVTKNTIALRIDKIGKDGYVSGSDKMTVIDFNTKKIIDNIIE